MTTTAGNNIFFKSMIDLLQVFDGQALDILRVLTYHRIDEPEHRPHLYPGLSISPSIFKAQMAYLKESDYHFISARELLDRFTTEEPEPLPARSVLITFDDGYLDYKENAWPILKSFGIPAILFVATAYPDHPERVFWWDKLYHCLTTTDKNSLSTPIGELPLGSYGQQLSSYKQLRDYLSAINHKKAIEAVEHFGAFLEVPSAQNAILSWEDLRHLSAQGLAIGPHTRTHPRLDQISIDETEREISSSMQDLREKLNGFGEPYPIFAYPGGGVAEEIIRVLEKSDIKVAFGTDRGINNLRNANPLLLNRINVGRKTTLPLLRAQLLHRPARLFSKFF